MIVEVNSMPKIEKKIPAKDFTLTFCDQCGESKPVEFQWIDKKYITLICRDCYDSLASTGGKLVIKI